MGRVVLSCTFMIGDRFYLYGSPSPNFIDIRVGVGHCAIDKIFPPLNPEACIAKFIIYARHLLAAIRTVEACLVASWYFFLLISVCVCRVRVCLQAHRVRGEGAQGERGRSHQASWGTRERQARRRRCLKSSHAGHP